MSDTQITISARVPESLGQQVDRLATAIRRNRSWVIEEAVRAYIAQEMQFLAAVEEGIAAYAAGDVVDHAEVVADFAHRQQAQ
ncbi:MAG: ribbon-helix-helix protein, CopG family [Chloroflexota bacterium]|nr:ribbon-helix-helix protein, CopG family [Chloroflexota bacterium]